MTNCQLYLISPPQWGGEGFLSALAAAIASAAENGVEIACLQLRFKDTPDDIILAAAKAVRPLLATAGIALIINDRADLAKAAGADGVHLGQDDGSVKAARALLGDAANIGVTCHNSRHLAMIAAEAGADYVAFGAFYETKTKPTAFRAEPEILSIWTETTLVPCVAIGGITPLNAAPLVAAGADYLAVSSAIWSHPDGAGKSAAEFAPCLLG